MADSSDTGSSTSAFVITLIANGLVGITFVWLFLLLRPKNRRVYEPRSLKDVQTIPEEERTDPVPEGYFGWVEYLLSKPHSFLIQHTGVDGYFLIRYIGIVGSLSFMGCLIILPILLPVNATSGNNLKGFDLLSFSNVSNKNRFYAHVFLSWIFFGMFTYIIYKELYYYVVFRHAMQTTPLYDGLLSSRTVIITELHKDIAQEGEMQMRFPKASDVAFAHDLSDLQELCKERAKNAAKYEAALNKVLNKCVKMTRNKTQEQLDKLYNNGTKPKEDLETYVPYKKRPKHRLGKLPLCLGGKKVSTLSYSSKRIGELNDEIHEKQADWASNDRQPACFIQFESQLEAQRCFQSVEAILGTTHFGKCFIGHSPEDINWDTMRLSGKERHSRRAVANTIMVLLIIFWAIPVTVVGAISNINFLTDKVPFLQFINNMPDFLMGIITGLLPIIALAILMSLVPPFILKLGKMSGCVTAQETDLYCQAWYYAFSVVEIFLVVTAASSASSTVDSIIDDPSSAMTLLASNLPKASNFYIMYFLLKGLTGPTWSILQAANLVLSKFLGRFLDSTPRQKWKRYNTLSIPRMGVVYPGIEVLVCIYICYSIIAPILLFFSTVMLSLIYVVYLYNLNYVFGFSFDLKGRNYPRALFQIFVGIYLSEVCLLGLFIMAKTWGPLVLEVVWIVVTALAHIYMKRKFMPLLDAVPLSAIRYARGESGYSYPTSDLGSQEIRDIAEEMKGKYESDNTHGILTPVTRDDLKKADLIPDNNNTPENNGLVNPFESSSERTSSYRSNGDGDSMKKMNEPVIKKSSTLSSSAKNRDNNAAGNESTFVPENDKFRKFHYSDVEALRNKRPYGDDDHEQHGPEGALPVNADSGVIYSNPAAVMKEPQAFPPDVLETNTWSQRILQFFSPRKSYPFDEVRTRFPYVFNTSIEYDEEYLNAAYTDPCVREKDPIVWCCKDPLGVSKQQIQEARSNGLDVSDDFTRYDEKGKVIFTYNPPDYEPEVKK
ncbi:Phm7p SKDI_15G0750 [Saccharomyces kudriavzevii IFO 1802]|uniref:Uncharacterized protein n=1 Tax=Saccharomyces kudriavzevii (strain ATCC MYA-4449 / AS 2.2408 / CBS 8840 / NBRC 1802 / NCYC 2889) TaxID=226230 RepID=A0AA35J726_SACK1|nr:uncharacterized protein SKDI_15G0750 [Saccharomyces kudriavzevii IFO 1802]CAI4050859.1 hypothetical protein SKDI_15G0750 [Saccharomyces kudriavzevii IFO 1802]